MAEGYRVGDKVRWKWGDGHGEGRIAERFTEKVTRTIKGREVTREANSAEPAYLIEQDDGDRVLKAHSELERTG